MDVFSQMTAYDLVIAGLFVALVGRGIWLGLIKQVASLVALYLGFFIASNYNDQLLPALADVSDNPKVVFLTSYVLLFLAAYIVVMLLGKLLGLVISMTITSWFDRLLGAVVGFAKAAILAVLLHMILGTILAPENQMLRTCVTCDALNGAADFTRALIRDEEVRKSLLQQEPAIAIDTIKEYLVPSEKEEDTGSGDGKETQDTNPTE
jgi:membrane protein required for colicin V production